MMERHFSMVFEQMSGWSALEQRYNSLMNEFQTTSLMIFLFGKATSERHINPVCSSFHCTQ
jgi:hypothetical protein